MAAALCLAGCSADRAPDPCASIPDAIPVSVATKAGARTICAGVADTAPEQSRGLMFRTDLKADEGLLFAPYPPDGGEPREASFWMKDTPSALDIVFIRADRTIARIAENSVPFSEEPIPSHEPVAAVLEIRGGRAAELGIAEGDKVHWTQPTSDAGVAGRDRAG